MLSSSARLEALEGVKRCSPFGRLTWGARERGEGWTCADRTATAFAGVLNRTTPILPKRWDRRFLEGFSKSSAPIRSIGGTALILFPRTFRFESVSNRNLPIVLAAPPFLHGRPGFESLGGVHSLGNHHSPLRPCGLRRISNSRTDIVIVVRRDRRPLSREPPGCRRRAGGRAAPFTRTAGPTELDSPSRVLDSSSTKLLARTSTA